MASSIGNTMQKDGSKSDIAAENRQAPTTRESPFAFALEDSFDAAATSAQAVPVMDPRSSFSFENDRCDSLELQAINDIGSLRPQSLVSEVVATASGADDTRMPLGVNNRANNFGECKDDNTSLPTSSSQVQNGHPNAFYKNPFAAGLEAIASDDVQEVASILYNGAETSKGRVMLVNSKSEEYDIADQYFTPTKECSDQQELSQSSVDVEAEDVVVLASAMKRESFSFEEGTDMRTFSADDVILAINCGGLPLDSEPHGISYSKDDYYTGGEALKTEKEISGVPDARLYQSSRYGNFSYSFRDLPNGNYLVDLHFAEITFRDGPPGMRVFNVAVQEEKVISELDVYEEVGSNNALILSVCTSTTDGTLSITFEGLTGSPTISAISIHSALPPSCTRLSRNSAVVKKLIVGTGKTPPNTKPLGCEHEFLLKEKELCHITKHTAPHHECNNETRKSDYEARVKELTNECQEAWISLQHSNRVNDTLREDLCAKSLCVDSLATAVENQLSEMNAIKERTCQERQRWFTQVAAAYEEIVALKKEQQLLLNNANEWVASFPDPSIVTRSVQSLLTEHQDLRRKYANESYERKQLYNKVLELKGNIRVFCRCRPLSQAELLANSVSVTEYESASSGDIVVRHGAAGKKLFKFDRVFSPQDDQSDVFADTAPVVVSVLDGYNVCIFAYGQTGTGKTWTMEGSTGNRGVNYRTLEELFTIAAQRKGEINYDISVSVMEVYNEQIRDLLVPVAAQDQPTKKLEIKQAAEGGHHVPGIVEARVTSMAEVWSVLQAGSNSRTVGSTRANDHSSRSHCMLCVMVRGENTITGEVTKSKLWLVDLAGSERVAKSDAQGDRLKEAQNINKSLSALGDVIQALAMKSSHVPFRNSKLTHLLQDSLGGDSKTLMFVQISPNEADLSETLCSLNFASRVRGVELGPARKHLDSNELFKYKQLAEKSKQESRLKDELIRKLEEKLQSTDTKLKAKDQMCQALSEKLKEMGDLDAQLLNERRARLVADASCRDQKATMEKLVVESKLSLDKLAEKLASESRHAKDASAAEARQAREALELVQSKEALEMELKEVKEALHSASATHAKEVSRLMQQLKANAICTTPMQESTRVNGLQTQVEALLRRPALVEAGSGSHAIDRTPTVEYVVKPPNISEVMRNSCTGEVFANENAYPTQNTDVSDVQVRVKGILKPSNTKYVSPNNPPKRVPGRSRRSGFAVKPAVQVNSLVRRSHDSVSSSCNSLSASFTEEELQRLCGGLDLIATSNTSTFDASLQTLAQVLESTPINKGPSSRFPQPKSVHFRSPLLLPPRKDLEMRDGNSPVQESENNRPPTTSNVLATKTARRTTLPAKPSSRSSAAGSNRVVAPVKAQALPVLREKRWN